jgi:hypothetical protein
LVTITVRCAGNHSALRRQFGERRADLGGGGENIGEVGMAVAAPRRGADRDEHRIRPRYRRREVGRKAQPPGRRVARHQLVEPRLVNRNVAAQQPLDLAGILVDAGHQHPNSEKQAPDTNPTYPVPIIAMRIDSGSFGL